jgi:hypothetical protein
MLHEGQAMKDWENYREKAVECQAPGSHIHKMSNDRISNVEQGISNDEV